MNTNEVIKQLKLEAATNEAAKAVFLLWAIRERARQTVTLSTLMHSMTEQGFNFPKEKYQNLFRMLASLNVGRVTWDSKGQISGLTDIKIKLQSLGRAACGQELGLRGAKRKNRFKNLPEAVSENPPEPPKKLITDLLNAPEPPPPAKTTLVLTVLIGGKAVNIQVPPELSSEELTTLFRHLQEGPGKSV